MQIPSCLYVPGQPTNEYYKQHVFNYMFSGVSSIGAVVQYTLYIEQRIGNKRQHLLEHWFEFQLIFLFPGFPAALRATTSSPPPAVAGMWTQTGPGAEQLSGPVVKGRHDMNV